MPVTISGSGAATFPSVTSNSQIFNGSSSGTTTVQASATASGTITLPAGTGTVAVNGVSSNIVSGTAVTPSGTSVVYNDIPSWVKRITFMLNAVSSNGTSSYILQLGTGTSGSPTWKTSGYTGGSQYASSVGTLVYSTNAAGIYVAIDPVATSNITSSISINLLDASTNTWATSFTTADAVPTNFYLLYCAWSVPVSATVTQIRLTTVGGTNTFDAGKVNILYE